ncbi:MAG: class I SAM-dependent methyltransferase [Nitrospirae bacterium]|nr:class I SAM-dependent methyltransferase [Nitrospirota bacterium]
MPSEEDINFIGGGIGVGLEFFDYFMKYCNLQPSDSVLDVGCGIGRMAFPLTAYLSTAGRYEGFDIYDSGITWAKENITPLYPNFNFQKANIFNKLYNPHGRVVSSEFAFPYSDAYFDFVYLTSVFTHMYPDDVRQYLKEISRVIKRGSKCLLTCFLLNTESIKFIQNGNSTLRLVHKINGCFTADKKIPEKAIGFHENDLLKWISEQKLIVAQTLYGSWCGRKDFTSYQDILIIEKPDDASK